ncbi:MAG: alpha-galactosidase [Clostridia bacterium]|nr:alpha-galactosidase [Clostridia bacterium]
MQEFYYQILLTYTDGVQSVIPFRVGTHEVSDRYVRVLMCWSDIPYGNRLKITLQGIEAKPLRYFDVKLQIPDDIYCADPLVFISGYSTNDVAACSPLKNKPYNITRDNILYKAGNRFAGAGYTSADRFFTYILLEDKWFLLRHSMENKCLKKGLDYDLEGMFFSYPVDPDSFFEAYTDFLLERYEIPRLDIPTGWCSWSCYYKDVDEEKIQRAYDELNRYYSEKKVNTLQIDDGWQTNTSFSGFWEVDREKFPNGLKGIAQDLKKDGITFGLWLAPLLASRASGFYTVHPEFKNTAHQPGEPEHSYSFGEDPVWPLDIGEQQTLDYICSVFRRCNKEYGAEYFKLDFMMFALLKLSNIVESFVIYEEDYATAIYRRAIKAIRDTVGDSFMLACGSPIAESVGIFNGIRVTPDIIWGKLKMAPSAWDLIKMCTNSIACRYFYNGKIFVNDPDGLVVRDFDQDDGFDVTYQEARTWATSVAMSGGSSLINEQMERIGGARREFFSHILPPLGVAARPVDFFEQPQPSKLYINNPDGSVIVALYNFSDHIEDLELDLADVGIKGDALCMRTWTKSVVGTVRGKLVCKDVIGHSAEVFVLVPVGKEPRFAFACCNIYGGAGVYSWSFSKKRLSVTAGKGLSACNDNKYYVYLPNSYEVPEQSESIALDNGCLIEMKAVGGVTETFEFVKKRKK